MKSATFWSVRRIVLSIGAFLFAFGASGLYYDADRIDRPVAFNPMESQAWLAIGAGLLVLAGWPGPRTKGSAATADNREGRTSLKGSEMMHFRF